MGRRAEIRMGYGAHRPSRGRLATVEAPRPHAQHGRSDAPATPFRQPAPSGRSNRWRGLLGLAECKVFLGVFVVLILVRLTLPFLISPYVNRVLDRSESFAGSVGDVAVALCRGGYQIEDIELRKPKAASSQPFLEANRLDLTLDWSALFQGTLAGDVVLHRPVVQFVATQRERSSQTGEEVDWKEWLRDLFPFRANRFVIRDAEIRFLSIETDPKVDLVIEDFFLELTNLTNVTEALDTPDALPASLEAAGRPFGTGELEAVLAIDPSASVPEFDLEFALRKIQLTELNDFFLAYGDVDLEDGTLDLYVEVAARSGRFEGYIKPIFQNVEVLRWKEIDGPKEAVEAFWEGMIAAAAEVLENQPRDRLATRIPLEGTIDDVQIGALYAALELLENAFVRAILPGFDNSIDFQLIGDAATP